MNAAGVALILEFITCDPLIGSFNARRRRLKQKMTRRCVGDGKTDILADVEC